MSDRSLPESLADSVVLTIKAALGPVLERLATAEQSNRDLQIRLQDVVGLRDRLVTVETKAAMPMPIQPEPATAELMTPVLERMAAMEARLAVLGDLRDRVVTVETKAAMPVPAVDLASVLERVAKAEARLDTLGDLRDQVVTLETKAAIPIPPADLGDVPDRLAALEHRAGPAVVDLQRQVSALEQTTGKDAARIEGYTAFLQRDAAALSERVAVLETRPLVPGPPGAPGVPGKDGADGLAGKDGSAGLSFEGVYQDGKSYELGHLVTWAGSSWHCNEPTTTKPGDGSKDWTLMVKRGQNGRDGRDAPGALPVVSVGRPQ